MNPKPKALPTDRVMVLNYRKKPAEWEPATVYHTTGKYDKKGSCRFTYDVVLDRQRMRRGMGVAYWLYFGDDSIEKIK
jgi:hypothetical protein